MAPSNGQDTGPNARPAPPPWGWPPPWWQRWRRADAPGDATAGLVVAIMLVPQSLAYAMLAGLPPHAGLLASVLPLLAYALFGSSRVLSVGPAAITSLMVAQALAPLAPAGSAAYIGLSALLAVGSGVLMLAMGAMRLGFLSQLMSQPVVQGFTVASAVLILAGQLGPLLGLGALGHTLPDMVASVWQIAGGAGAGGWADAFVGLGAVLALGLGPRAIRRLADARGQARAGLLATRLWPLAVLVLASTAAALWNREQPDAVRVVGALQLGGWAEAWTDLRHTWDAGVLRALALPVLLVSLVGFVSSVSVAQAFALHRGDRIDADRELLGLGLANVGSGVLGGLAVSGGLSRTVVNEAAGARSPLAGVLTAALLLVLILTLLPALAWLPRAALAAVIIMAVVNLISWQPLRATWSYDRADAGAFVTTAAGVLLLGFEAGLLGGLTWSLAAMVWRHSQPHVAEVGRVPGSEHFRNVARHRVERLPDVLLIRIDESLDFTNIQQVEQRLCAFLAARPEAHHVVLLMSAVNHIDHTALQALLAFEASLAEQGRVLYLSEIKGPVADRLQASEWPHRFQGRVFLSAQHAWARLAPAADATTHSPTGA